MHFAVEKKKRRFAKTKILLKMLLTEEVENVMDKDQVPSCVAFIVKTFAPTSAPLLQLAFLAKPTELKCRFVSGK